MKTVLVVFGVLCMVALVSQDSVALSAAGAALLMIVSGGFNRRTQF